MSAACRGWAWDHSNVDVKIPWLHEIYLLLLLPRWFLSQLGSIWGRITITHRAQGGHSSNLDNQPLDLPCKSMAIRLKDRWGVQLPPIPAENNSILGTHNSRSLVYLLFSEWKGHNAKLIEKGSFLQRRWINRVTCRRTQLRAIVGMELFGLVFGGDGIFISRAFALTAPNVQTDRQCIKNDDCKKWTLKFQWQWQMCFVHIGE